MQQSPARRGQPRSAVGPLILVQLTLATPAIARPNDCLVPVSVNPLAGGHRQQPLQISRSMVIDGFRLISDIRCPDNNGCCRHSLTLEVESLDRLLHVRQRSSDCRGNLTTDE